ncbi:MAG: hypothetical protein LIP06_05630 [Tannerellaceae bacterium]|nr:hypothetical protein [Tannerellaceae bacterium]
MKTNENINSKKYKAYNALINLTKYKYEYTPEDSFTGQDLWESDVQLNIHGSQVKVSISLYSTEERKEEYCKFRIHDNYVEPMTQDCTNKELMVWAMEKFIIEYSKL